MPGMPGMFFGSYPVPPPPPYMNVGAPHMGNMQMVTSYPIVLNTQTGQMQWANTPTNPLPVSTGGHVQQHISHNNQSGMRVQGSDGIHSNNRHKNKHNNNNNNHHNNNNSYNNAQRENHAHDNHLRRTNPRGMGFQNQVQVPSNNNEFYQQPYLPHSQINYQNMNMNMNNGIYPFPGVSQQQYYRSTKHGNKFNNNNNNNYNNNNNNNSNQYNIQQYNNHQIQMQQQSQMPGTFHMHFNNESNHNNNYNNNHRNKFRPYPNSQNQNFHHEEIFNQNLGPNSGNLPRKIIENNSGQETGIESSEIVSEMKLEKNISAEDSLKEKDKKENIENVKKILIKNQIDISKNNNFSKNDDNTNNSSSDSTIVRSENDSNNCTDKMITLQKEEIPLKIPKIVKREGRERGGDIKDKSGEGRERGSEGNKEGRENKERDRDRDRERKEKGFREKGSKDRETKVTKSVRPDFNLDSDFPNLVST